MNYQATLEAVKEYVYHYYATHVDEVHIYHNLKHTEDVVAAAIQIANHYRLDDKDFFTVVAAAWFHDIGYCGASGKEHEQRGAELALQFLKGSNVEDTTAQAVANCILSTRLPQTPASLLEQIVCDADLFHLGTDDFAERNKAMRKEAELVHDKKIDKHDWRSKTIALLQSHHYHTDYCRLLLGDRKEQNLQKLLSKQQDQAPVLTFVDKPVVLQQVESTQPKKQKSDRPERGIETMFRISSNNHQRLSDMADNKAHIMITTTSIIISVLLSVLLRKLEEFPHLTIPVIMLLAICVITMVFSILATRPNLPEGTFTKADIDNQKVNLLFFGNFYKMSLDEYTQGMESLMESRDYLYGSLIKDVYSQGIVLGRKYKLLRAGYNVFMFGIVTSVLAFLIATLFFK
jgi:predicted metal-dependent HD superfamily phosphohydrolase